MIKTLRTKQGLAGRGKGGRPRRPDARNSLGGAPGREWKSVHRASGRNRAGRL